MGMAEVVSGSPTFGEVARDGLPMLTPNVT
jgi:hypothetical protein